MSDELAIVVDINCPYCAGRQMVGDMKRINTYVLCKECGERFVVVMGFRSRRPLQSEMPIPGWGGRPKPGDVSR